MTIIAAFLLDLAIGDPAWLPHPVILIGKFIARLETLLRPEQAGSPHSGEVSPAPQPQADARPETDAGSRADAQPEVGGGSHAGHRPRPCGDLVRGAVLTVTTVGLAWSAATAVQGVAGAVHPFLGWIASAWLTYTTIACRGLGDAALAVKASLQAGDMERARRQTAMIVGRDTAHLNEAEIVRAVVETVAENLVDAVVSPVFYAALAGAPAAMAYRAVNTLDSMVGYRNEHYLYFGRASARLDDVVNYVPARIAGGLVILSALLTGHDWRGALRILRMDGRKHPSPNSGLPEAAFAGALGVRLGGLNYYSGQPHLRPYMGDARSPLEWGLIGKATVLMRVASVTAAAFSAAFSVAFAAPSAAAFSAAFAAPSAAAFSAASAAPFSATFVTAIAAAAEVIGSGPAGIP